MREWLRDHEFATKSPHTRLSGSYARSTATELIPDVDVLLFTPDDQEERTPNAVLRELYGVLKDYPDGRLDILTLGHTRFRVISVNEDEAYLRAEVEWLSNDGETEAPKELVEEVTRLYKSLLNHHGRPGIPEPIDGLPASYQLAASDLINHARRQRILELSSEKERLDVLSDCLESVSKLHLAAQGNGRLH